MEYQYFLQKSMRKSISIRISNEGKIIVKAPLISTQKEIEDFLLLKRNWILSHLEKVDNQNKIAEEEGIFTNEEMLMMKKKAKKIIPERVAYYAKLGGITYNKIFIRCQKTRWGSCSISGNLNFNCLLVLMPLEILDSVVVHELCHRKHMNHSKAFYNEIYKLFPDYKRCDKWLKNNGLSYLKRVPENI